MLNNKIIFGDSIPQIRNVGLNFSEAKQSFVTEEIIKSKDKRPNLDRFKSALLNSKILDAVNSEFHGSYIVLPFGIELFNCFYHRIRKSYQSFGLKEYRFPSISSISSFDSSKRIQSLSDKLLHIGNDSSFANDLPLGTLSPTGEQTIYSYWKKIIKTEKDLPLKIYQVSKFFRPYSKKRTKSIFKSLESPDVFEFHCAYSNLSEQQKDLEKAVAVMGEILRLTYVPFLQTQRPLWTNNRFVSHTTFGFDTLLPNLKTIQVGSIYDQRQIFSKEFGIEFIKDGNKQHTFHLTGAVSKRLVLSNLFLGLKNNNTIAVHPNLSPNQINLIIKGETSNLDFNKDQLKRDLERNSLSCAVDDDSTSTIPLSIIIFNRRNAYKNYKIVFLRNDIESEAVLFADNLDKVVEIAKSIIDLISNDFIERQKLFFHNNINHCEEISLVKNKFTQSGLIWVYATCSQDVVEIIEKNISGEILGFSVNDVQGKCVVTNKNTKSIAFISKRI